MGKLKSKLKMSEEKSKAIIKQLTKKKVVAKESPERASTADNKDKKDKKVKPNATVQKIKNMLPGQKTMTDAALFGAAVFVIYYYGKDIANAVENVVPTEQSIN